MSLETNIPKNPNGEPHRIKELFAFIMDIPEDGGEGIPAMAARTPNKMMPYAIPLIGSDRERIESLRDAAQQAADEQQKEIVLCKFTERVEVERIQPRSPEEIRKEAEANIFDVLSKGEPKRGEIRTETCFNVVCPHCDYKISGGVDMDGSSQPPQPGALTFCLRCGELSMFKGEPGALQLCIMTEDEKDEMAPEFKTHLIEVHKKWKAEIKPKMDEKYGTH